MDTQLLKRAAKGVTLLYVEDGACFKVAISMVKKGEDR